MSFKMKGFPQIAGAKEGEDLNFFNVDPTNPNEMPDQDGDGISDYIDADPTTPYSAEEIKEVKTKKDSGKESDKKEKIVPPKKQTRYIKHKGHDTTPSYNLG